MELIAILVLVIVVVIILVIAFLLRRKKTGRASREYSPWRIESTGANELYNPNNPGQYGGSGGSAPQSNPTNPYSDQQPGYQQPGYQQPPAQSSRLPATGLPPPPPSPTRYGSAPTLPDTAPASRPPSPTVISPPSSSPSSKAPPRPPMSPPAPSSPVRIGSAPPRSEPSIAPPPPAPWEPLRQSGGSASVLEDTIIGSIGPVVRGDVQASDNQAVEGATPQDRTDVHYSDVSFPGQTVVGRIEALRVAITRKAMNTRAAPLALERSLDDTQPMKVDAYVVVSPLDFDLESSNVQTITVFPNTDSAPVLFKLVAKSEGRKTIAVEFFQNARYLGRAELETAVSQQVQYPHPVSAQVTLEMSATQLPPDLTILFDRVPVGNDRHYYRYRLLSPIRELNLWFDEFRSPETNITPQGFLEETFTQLNRMLSSDTPDEFFFGRLNSIGMSLYRRLFSDDFKRLYWNSLRSKVKTIVIISFEPWIPWELVRPFNHETNEADDGFLCEKFNLTRWLAGAGFPDIMSLEQLGLIISTSSLDSAKLEAEEIKKLLGSNVRDILSSSPSVYRLLRTNDLSGLHFACHGSYNKDNPDMSTLSLEDGTWLSPIDIDGDGLTFGKNRPLVFLNACETGQGGYALTGMGGWAEAFVGRARCSGFIGSIWKAKDESACKFAVAFYRNFLDGKTIAEAARLARLSIKQTGDPTWLSYTVYANPLARLVIDRSLQRDNPILQPGG